MNKLLKDSFAPVTPEVELTAEELAAKAELDAKTAAEVIVAGIVEGEELTEEQLAAQELLKPAPVAESDPVVPAEESGKTVEELEAEALATAKAAEDAANVLAAAKAATAEELEDANKGEPAPEAVVAETEETTEELGDTDETVTATEADPVVEPEAFVATTVLELNDLAETEADYLELENAAHATSRVYQTLLSLEETMGDNVLNCEGASIIHATANTALESIFSTFGDLPTREAFDEDETAAEATQFTKEALSENIKKVWAALVKFLKAMVAKGLEVLGQVKKAATELEAKASEYANKAATAPSDLIMQEKTLPVPASHVKAMTVDGKTVNLAKDLAAQSDLLDDMQSNNIGLEVSLDFLSRISDRTLEASNIGKFEGMLYSELESQLKSAGYDMVDSGDKDESTKHFFSKPMMGTVWLRYAVTVTGEKGLETITSVAVSKEATIDSLSLSDRDSDVSALDMKSIEATLTGVADVCVGIVKADAVTKDAKKLSKDLIKVGDETVKLLAVMEKDSDVKDADLNSERNTIRQISAFARIAYQPNALKLRCALASAKAAYKFADMSFKNYSKEVAAA